MNLGEALRECTLALLRRIAQSHSIPTRDDLLRNELAELILERFSEEGYLASYLSKLPVNEKQVLFYVSTHDWQGKSFLLERQFPRHDVDASGPSPCLSLLQKGLLFRTYGLINSWRGELYHVPEELRSAVESRAAPEVGDRKVAVPQVAAPPVIEERNVAVDLFCLLSYLRRADRRSQAGGLSRHDLQRLEQECLGGRPSRDPLETERRWRFLLRLSMAGGWVWKDGPFLRPGRAAVTLLGGRQSEVQRRLLDRYVRERGMSDLAESGSFRQPVGSRRIDESVSRQMLLHHLEEMVGPTWTTEDGFSGALRRLNPDFLREDFASLGSAVVDASAEVELYGPDSWPLVEGEWVKYVLRGPLYWLGVVRWGRSPAGDRVAFQTVPSEPGAGQGEPSFDSPGVVLRSDFSVLAAPKVDLGLLYRLEPYMHFRGVDTGARAYRVTSASVQQGIAAGGSASELLNLVSTACSGGVGSEVTDQLRKWAASYGRLRLEGSVLLTATSEDYLFEIRNLPGVASCLGEPVGQASYRVLPNRFHRLLAALREAGHPPLIDPSTGSTRARGLTGDLSLVRECLFAIQVLRSLYGQVELENADEAQNALEAVLGPEASDEISKRAQDAVRRIRSLGESGW